MDLQLKDRVAVITGASSGIGRATALAFARERASVAITYASHESEAHAVCEEARAAGAPEVFATRMILEEANSIQAAFATISARFSRIDCLIANAFDYGLPAWGGLPFEGISEPELTSALNANVAGTFRTVQAALPAMRGRQWGRIVFLSSGLAEEGAAGASTYALAKSALLGLARSLAWELGPEGILVNLVSPGYVMTAKNRARFDETARDRMANKTITKKLSSDDDVAALALFLGSNGNRNISGEVVHEGSTTGRASF